MTSQLSLFDRGGEPEAVGEALQGFVLIVLKRWLLQHGDPRSPEEYFADAAAGLVPVERMAPYEALAAHLKR